jgi:hypothetical protein
MNYPEIVRAVNGVLGQYDMPLTLRQVYYRLVAAQVIENTFRNYKNLGRLLVKAREEGDVDDTRFEDRARYTAGGDFGYMDPEAFLKGEVERLLSSPDRYTRRLWDDQPKYVEVWVEKDALRTLVESVTEEYRVRLTVGRGYASYTFVNEAAGRIHYELTKDPEREVEAVVLYLGDHDPSGVNIQEDLNNRLLRYGAPEVTMKRVALTPGQIEEYHLPSAPIKMTDSRAGAFLIEHGNEAVELDALEPPVLQALIREAVLEEIDVDRWNEKVKEIKKERGALVERCEKIKEALKEVRP